MAIGQQVLFRGRGRNTGMLNKHCILIVVLAALGASDRCIQGAGREDDDRFDSPPSSGRVRTQNKPRPPAVKRRNILLIGSDAGWDFRYLRNHLIRLDKRFSVSVWQQNASAELNQKASTGPKLNRLPNSLMALIGTKDASRPGYDLVILHDPKPVADGFDVEFVKLLQKYVRVHGRGLCYIAGNKYTEIMLNKGDPIMVPLAGMLPVMIAPNTAEGMKRIRNEKVPPKAWPLRVTRQGLDHRITDWGMSGGKTPRECWQAMPSLFWTHPVAQIKPAARVLLESTDPTKLTIDKKPGPGLAVHCYGTGRVAYLGTNATWRWRAVQDGYFYRRFWNNMVEYLADTSARNMVIATGGACFSTDEKITIEVEVYDPDNDYRPLQAMRFAMLLDPVEAGRTTVELILTPVPDRAGCFKVIIDAPPVGKYDLMPKPMPGRRNDPTQRVVKRIITIAPRAKSQANVTREAGEGHVGYVGHVENAG